MFTLSCCSQTRSLLFLSFGVNLTSLISELLRTTHKVGQRLCIILCELKSSLTLHATNTARDSTKNLLHSLTTNSDNDRTDVWPTLVLSIRLLATVNSYHCTRSALISLHLRTKPIRSRLWPFLQAWFTMTNICNNVSNLKLHYCDISS